MTRESGFESITARGLAQRIGCSTQPIFRAYANMRQLKQEVWEKTRTFFSEYMASQKREEAPLFLAMGLNYVELAQKERNLFLFLCRSDDSPATDIRQLLGYGDVSSAVKDVPGMEGLAREQVGSFLSWCGFSPTGWPIWRPTAGCGFPGMK